jgi:hypothetical protein
MYLQSVIYLLVVAADASDANRHPAPLLREDGSKPPGHEKERIFVDPKSGHLVVFGPWDFTAPQQPRSVVVELGKFVEPYIRNEIMGDGEQIYQYTFGNGSGARQIAPRWLFSGLDIEAARMEGPRGWKPFVPPPFMRGRANDPATRSITNSSVSFSHWEQPLEVRPGTEVTGFRIRSPLLPGPIEVWVQGLKKSPEFPSENPEPLERRLYNIRWSAYAFGHTATFAPLIDPALAVAQRAKRFAESLDVLTETKTIAPDSIVLQRLRTYLQSVSAGAPADANFFAAFSPPDLSAAERELIRAASIAMRTRNP